MIETSAGPIVVDTKWTDLDQIGSHPISDLYQLAAYGVVYHANRVILLYPGVGQSQPPTVRRYTATDRQVEIWRVDPRMATKRNEWESAQSLIKLEAATDQPFTNSRDRVVSGA